MDIKKRQSKIRAQIQTAMEAIDKPMTADEIYRSGYCQSTLTAIDTALAAMRRDGLIAKVDNAYYLRTTRNAKRLAEAVDQSGGVLVRNFT